MLISYNTIPFERVTSFSATNRTLEVIGFLDLVCFVRSDTSIEFVQLDLVMLPVLTLYENVVVHIRVVQRF